MISWPMNVLTVPAGENRKLVVHPKKAVDRTSMRRDKNNMLRIIGEDSIKIKLNKMNGSIQLFAENKLQGHRHIYCRDADGFYHLFGRRLNVDGEYIDIIREVSGYDILPDLPKETAVDCELIYPGHPDSEVPTAIKSYPWKLKLIAFAVPILQGKYYFGTFMHKCKYRTGRKLLNEILPQRYVIPVGEEIIAYSIEELKESMEDLLYKAEINKIEGYVLKEQSFDGWWKLKLINEMDVFVTGFNISNSDTRFGIITSVNISTFKDGKIIDLGRVSGFDEDEMDKMTSSHSISLHDPLKNKFYHRVLRVQYQEIASKGKLKHAFFDCWREDKDWKDCTLDEA